LASQKPPLNPFHFLLGLMGVIFTVTAIAYTVMIVRESKQTWVQPPPVAATDKPAEPDMREHPLLKLLTANGVQILVGQIALIAVLTVAAIGLDRWRDLRAEKIKLAAKNEVSPPETADDPLER
jgi:hypothetical protein